jgi:hypothetical protein
VVLVAAMALPVVALVLVAAGALALAAVALAALAEMVSAVVVASGAMEEWAMNAKLPLLIALECYPVQQLWQLRKLFISHTFGVVSMLSPSMARQGFTPINRGRRWMPMHLLQVIWLQELRKLRARMRVRALTA